MKQSKNYIVFINDHSGSMGGIAHAAMKDYNANIEAIKGAATQEKLDTIVSVIGIGSQGASTVERQVVISNPHVLNPKTEWPCPGGTPLYDSLADAITLMNGLPDINEPHVSVLVMTTTDGAEIGSRYTNLTKISNSIREMQNTGRWTFVFRVPKGGKGAIKPFGVPDGNVQEWETSAAGMAATTAVNQAAMTSFFRGRAAGASASSSFYVDAANVNTAALTDISKEVTMYVSGTHKDDVDGMMISQFIMARRMKYLKGAAFYQLVKTEAKVGPDKIILIQDRATGKVFGGDQARNMLGLPQGQNSRVTPTQLAGYNIFIQSTSWNRKVPAATGVLYYEKLGTEFSQDEIDRFMKPAAPKSVASAPLSAQLPQVNNVAGRNIKANMPVNKKVIFYATRDEARNDKRLNGTNYIDLGSDKPKGQRFQKV